MRITIHNKLEGNGENMREEAVNNIISGSGILFSVCKIDGTEFINIQHAVYEVLKDTAEPDGVYSISQFSGGVVNAIKKAMVDQEVSELSQQEYELIRSVTSSIRVFVSDNYLCVSAQLSDDKMVVSDIRFTVDGKTETNICGLNISNIPFAYVGDCYRNHGVYKVVLYFKVIDINGYQIEIAYTRKGIMCKINGKRYIYSGETRWIELKKALPMSRE